MAIAEGDVRSVMKMSSFAEFSVARCVAEAAENKLAIFGLVVVVVITVASILGPPLIHKTLDLLLTTFPLTTSN